MIKEELPLYNRTTPDVVLKTLHTHWQAACEELGWLKPASVQCLVDVPLRNDGCPGLIFSAQSLPICINIVCNVDLLFF
jgi:hypothetical protein